MTLTAVPPSTALPDAFNDTHSLNLIPWRDKRLDAFGHDPRSGYVEQFWLSTLGPTTTWFLRHCAYLLEDCDAASVDLREAASTLGIGHQGGACSAMVKAMERACRFSAARPVGSTTLAVRLRLPHLSRRQLQRLPRPVQRRHADYLAADLESSDSISQQRLRARRLALGLVECGDELDEVELHLGRLQFHPAVAADAVRWAWAQHHGRIRPVAPDAA